MEKRKVGDRETAEVVYSTGDGRLYFACQLRQLSSLTVIAKEEQRYLPDLYRRQVEFLSCLMNPWNQGFTYDLRIISDPVPELYTRGRIKIALLCRIERLSTEEAYRYPGHFLDLLDAYFEEGEFELMKAERIPKLLAPFPVRDIVAVRRRCSRECLDTLRSGASYSKPLGFVRPALSNKTAESLLHIFPFVPSQSSFNTLFKLLLLEPVPVMVSFRLRPTAVAPEEERFLEQQIALCERYAQASIDDIPEDLSALRPTLREQARAFQNYQSRMLFGLRDDAALLTVEITSTRTLAARLADVVGMLITAPSGGKETQADHSQFYYLSGGYELVNLGGTARIRKAIEYLDQTILPHPLVPREMERLPYLFYPSEAAAVFRLPPATLEVPPGIDLRTWKDHPAPRNMPTRGLELGVNPLRNTHQTVYVTREDRHRHIYAVGQTGTGKTTLLKTMILSDIRAGEGVCVFDPHGDLYRDLLGKIPKERVADVVLLDPTDRDYPVGLNMLEHETESQRHFLVQEFVGILSRLMEDEFGPGAVGQLAGPLFFQHVRLNLLLAMSNCDDPGTLLEFYTIFQKKNYWRRWLPLRVKDPQLARWVDQVLPETDYLRPSSDGVLLGAYFGSKFEGFVFDPMLRNIFGQKRSTVSLREIMDSGKVLLVNLAKGELTETNARFLGMVLLAKLQAAAMTRVRVPKARRRPFHVYVDEFQNIATQSFITLLSEARKFGLTLVLANQFISQIRDPRIIESIWGNVGTIISFRLGQTDAELMEKKLLPVFTRHDLINLPNWQAYVSMLVDGQTVRPFNMETMPDPSPHDPVLARKVQESSRVKYSRRRDEVEHELESD